MSGAHHMQSLFCSRSLRAVRCYGLIGAMCLLPTGSRSGFAAVPSSQPMIGEVDDAVFRQGLRDRGLIDWLDQHLADTPPPDAADAECRRREQLIAESQNENLSHGQRDNLIGQAHTILMDLLVRFPEHPACLRWAVEAGRDLIERLAPEAFDAVLLFEFPGRERAVVRSLSAQAEAVLNAARSQVAARWKAIESLDEAGLEAARKSGAVRRLEGLDTDSATLLTWARLYQALTADSSPNERNRILADLLEDITERHAWTSLPPGHEDLQCGAFGLGAVAARLIGRYSQADQFARRIISTMRTIRRDDQLKRLHKIALLAIVEQIRILRDQARYPEAEKFLEQAKTWQVRSRPGDMTARLAILFVERSVLAGQVSLPGASPTPANGVSILQPASALLPLRRFADESVHQRDLLYGLLAGALAEDAAGSVEDEFAVQLLAGAAVAEASMAEATSKPVSPGRLTGVIVAVKKVLDSTSIRMPPQTRGELLYLLGRCHHLVGAAVAAAGCLADLVEQYPGHDRSAAAATEAVAVAQEHLRRAGPSEQAEARQLFIRSAGLFISRQPATAEAVRLQYFVGLAAEHNGQLEDAAQEYARVLPDDVNAVKAALGRVRCLTSLLAKETSAERRRSLLEQSLAAAAESAGWLQKRLPGGLSGENLCIAAELFTSWARLLNDPEVHRPADAVRALDRFEERFQNCPSGLALALNERIRALQQLNRLAEARTIVDRLVVVSPDAAGPVMARLLEAMRAEINTLADQAQDAAVVSLAEEGAGLAGSLLDWAAAHAGRLSDSDRATVRMWRGWMLLQADQPESALKEYEACRERLPAATKPSAATQPVGEAMRIEVELGRAECLLRLHRPEEALPVFTRIWQTSPDHSPNWWRSFVGSLQAHTMLGSDSQQVLNSVQQQRALVPNLGGERWRRQLELIEGVNSKRAGIAPARQKP